MEKNRYGSLSPGRSSQKAKEFQKKLKTYWKYGVDHQQGKDILGMYSDSHNIIINGTWIPFRKRSKIGTEYLTEYFQTGVSYLSVNTAGSVLSTLLKAENEITFWGLPLVCTFLKGVFDLRPALSRHSTTSNVSVALKDVKVFQALKQYNLKSLSYLFAFLPCITTAQKDQMFLNVNIDLIMFEEVKITIFEAELLK